MQARLDDDGVGLAACVPGEIMAHFCIAFQTMVLITQAPPKVAVSAGTAFPYNSHSIMSC